MTAGLDGALGLHWRALIEPGFSSNGPVRVALTIGGIVAVVSAIVGVFTVLRAESFAGHALTDVSTAGGSAAFLLGVSPVLGFVGIGLVGAGAMDVIGVARVRGRDLATGVVLGAATGLAALLLYLGTTTGRATGTTQQILFGSIFTVESSTVPIVVGFGLVALGLVALLYRPLLLMAMSPEIAAARGVHLRLVGVGFMIALAVSVGLSSLAIGSILSTALLVGPAASALRLTRRMVPALLLAVGIGVGATWLGVLLSYDSYTWSSARDGMPVSFFIVAITFVVYLVSGLPVVRAASDRGGRPDGPRPGAGEVRCSPGS